MYSYSRPFILFLVSILFIPNVSAEEIHLTQLKKGDYTKCAIFMRGPNWDDFPIKILASGKLIVDSGTYNKPDDGIVSIERSTNKKGSLIEVKQKKLKATDGPIKYSIQITSGGDIDSIVSMIPYGDGQGGTSSMNFKKVNGQCIVDSIKSEKGTVASVEICRYIRTIKTKGCVSDRGSDVMGRLRGVLPNTPKIEEESLENIIGIAYGEGDNSLSNGVLNLIQNRCINLGLIIFKDVKDDSSNTTRDSGSEKVL